MTSEIRQLLRSARVFQSEMPAFDPADTPDEPMGLFVRWLTQAIDAGVAQPHAMTLATSDRDGAVTARTLLLKDVDDAFWFASSSRSPKGRQLRENPRVALTLYWREQGRQVRVLGEASPGPRDVSVADFTARHPDSRAVALARPQSSPMASADDGAQELARSRREVDADGGLVPDDWTAYRVAPMQVEFWQATTGRDQVRLRYDRTDPSSWAKTRLWP